MRTLEERLLETIRELLGIAGPEGARLLVADALGVQSDSPLPTTVTEDQHTAIHVVTARARALRAHGATDREMLALAASDSCQALDLADLDEAEAYADLLARGWKPFLLDAFDDSDHSEIDWRTVNASWGMDFWDAVGRSDFSAIFLTHEVHLHGSHTGWLAIPA